MADGADGAERPAGCARTNQPMRHTDVLCYSMQHCRTSSPERLCFCWCVLVCCVARVLLVLLVVVRIRVELSGVEFE